MKLIYPEISTVLDFRDGSFPAIIIENPNLFYRFTDDLIRQANGGDGLAILSVDDEPIPCSGKLDILTDFFTFEINGKALVNKITARMEKQALTPEFYERSQKLLSEIERWLYDLAFQEDVGVEMPKLSISSLLKSSGLSLKEDYPSLAEKILIYMDLMFSNGLAQVFVLVNLRSLLDDQTMESFTDCCCQKGFKLLLLDNKVCCKLSREKRTVIDVDLCEF